MPLTITTGVSPTRTKGDYDKAIAEFTEATSTGSELRSVYYPWSTYDNKGVTYGDKGDFDKAIADLTEALRLDPKEHGGVCSRAGAYNNKGEWDKAIADWNEVLRLNPKDAVACFHRGLTYRNKGENDKSIADLNGGHPSGPEKW